MLRGLQGGAMAVRRWARSCCSPTGCGCKRAHRHQHAPQAQRPLNLRASSLSEVHCLGGTKYDNKNNAPRNGNQTAQG